MPQLWGESLSRAELCELVGDMEQVAGVTRLELSEGPERGVEVMAFRTGSGLDFEVVPGRGMDISRATYQGLPLSWLSANGVPHSAYFDSEGLGFLRGFFGGLLTTCGLLNAGGPCEDDGVKLGLHGRLNNTPARNVHADTHWDGDDYLLCGYGRVRESLMFGENVELVRRVQAIAGEKALRIVDEVTNRGHDTQPHMMLYHINLGWPVVAPGSRLVVSAHTVSARDAVAASGLPHCREFEPPLARYPEQVFYHDAVPDHDGLCQAGIVNPLLRGGFGVGITYRAAELDQLVQWKSMKRGTYVCGLEPANCRVTGRAEERAAGRLKFLEPGQSIGYDLKIEVLDGPADVSRFESAARR